MQLRILIPIVAGINKIIRLVGVLVFMKLADPTEFSVWITCSLILQFSVFLQLGVPGPACRECSIAIGKNDGDWKVVHKKSANKVKQESVLVDNFGKHTVLFVKRSHGDDTKQN